MQQGFFLLHMPSDYAIVKIDFRNAFNSVRRDRMLEAVLALAPDIYHLVYSAYSSSSHLFWDDHWILSAEGVQQGDRPPWTSLVLPKACMVHIFLLALHCDQKCI